jgi:hypothetical protein
LCTTAARNRVAASSSAINVSRALFDRNVRDVQPDFTNGQFGVWPEELPREGVLSGLATALEGVVEAWCRIRTQYREDLLNLESMPLARFKSAYRYAAKELDSVLKRVDRAYQAAQTELKELTRKHTPKSGGIAETIVEGEVRAHLRTLDEPARLAVLHQAAQTGDVVTLRAAILAPPILLPVSEEIRGLLQAGYASATDPEGVARVQQLQEGMRRTRRAAEALMVQVNALLPHRVGEAASLDRRAAEEAERFADREGKLAIAEQHMVPPRIEMLRGIGPVAVESLGAAHENGISVCAGA